MDTLKTGRNIKLLVLLPFIPSHKRYQSILSSLATSWHNWPSWWGDYKSELYRLSTFSIMLFFSSVSIVLLTYAPSTPKAFLIPYRHPWKADKRSNIIEQRKNNYERSGEKYTVVLRKNLWRTKPNVNVNTKSKRKGTWCRLYHRLKILKQTRVSKRFLMISVPRVEATL